MRKVFISLFALLLVSTSSNAQSSTTKVWIDDDLEFVADGETINWLTLYENDPNVDYVAFNIEILLPKGLTVATKKVGRDIVNLIEPTDRYTTTHTLASNLNVLPDNDVFNDLKIATTSGENNKFYPDDEDGKPLDALVRIGLIADPSMEAGTMEIRLKDACFVYEDAHYATYLNDVFFTTSINIVKPQTIDYTMTASGVGTFIAPFDCKTPEGLTVYTASGVDANSYVILNKSDSIKAYTPYIMEGEAGNYSFTGNVGIVNVEKTWQEGVLVGVLQPTQPPVNSFVLQNQNDKVAFYSYTEANTAKVGANRCYLTDSSATARSVIYIQDETTCISAILESDAPVDVYNSSGLLIRSNVAANKSLQELPEGIYIVNGIKVYNLNK